MKYYIVDENINPLYFDNYLLEFDNYNSADRFLESMIAIQDYLEVDTDVASIVQLEVFVDEDEEHFNATEYIFTWNGEECVLTEV